MTIKERIMAACRELAREKGFYRMTMDELAARSGVSKRTLYRYFRSKEDILEATIDSFMAEVAVAADHLADTTREPEDFLHSMLQQFFNTCQFIMNPVTLNDLRTHYPNLWHKIDSFRLDKIKVIMGYWFNQSNQATYTDIDPRIITAATMSCIQAVINPEFIINNGLTFEAAARQLSRFLSAAFTALK
jgi:AcrR family transcriptional regulator